jgi:hypothetical protein
VRRVSNGSAEPNARCVPSSISQHKSERPAEIHKHIVAVYGNVMNTLVSSPKKHLAGKNFDDDDEV